MKALVLVLLLLLPTVAFGQKAVPCVQRYVTYDGLTQHEFDALVDFTFNVGCGAFRKSTLLRKVNRGDVRGAANEFMRWSYVGKVQVRGLVKRRSDERRMFLSK